MFRALTLLFALLLDLAWGDPPNLFHPVVLMGHWLKKGRALSPARSRFLFGATWILAGLALFSLPWLKLKGRSLSLTALLLQALCLKPVFAYRNLRRRVEEVAQALAGQVLSQARHHLGWNIVSRDTRQ